MANCAALLAAYLPDCNWTGFYRMIGGELVLGPFAGKPACIRIPLGQGVCGAAAASGATQLVPDVHAFPGHIACDAASRSELVVPVRRGGSVIAVIDLDSPLPARFDADDAAGVEALAAEMIDRFGPLPGPTQNLLKLIEIKRQAIAAHIAKIDVGAKGTLVSFQNDSFPEPAGLFAYIDRLQGTAKLRPDNKLVINRAWSSPEARLNGLVQLTKGLSAVAKRAGKRAA